MIKNIKTWKYRGSTIKYKVWQRFHLTLNRSSLALPSPVKLYQGDKIDILYVFFSLVLFSESNSRWNVRSKLFFGSDSSSRCYNVGLKCSLSGSNLRAVSHSQSVAIYPSGSHLMIILDTVGSYNNKYFVLL